MSMLEAAMQAYNKSRKAAAINIRSINGFHYKNLTAISVGLVTNIESAGKHWVVTVRIVGKNVKLVAMSNKALHVKPFPNGLYGELCLFINKKGLTFFSIYRGDEIYQGDRGKELSERVANYIY